MTYEDNVAALAKQLGIRDDHRLEEDDLSVSTMWFSRGTSDSTIPVGPTDMNRAGRLFIQGIAHTGEGQYATEVLITPAVLNFAAVYFGDKWNDDVARPLIRALQVSKFISIDLKPTAPA